MSGACGMVSAATDGHGRDIAKSDCGCGDRLSSISPALSDTQSKTKI